MFLFSFSLIFWKLKHARVFACSQSVQHQLLRFVHIMDNNYSVNYKVLIIVIIYEHESPHHN